jgi:hypothetical protein
MRNLKFNQAIDLLRRPETRMIKQNHNGRTQHFIVPPGGAVNEETAQRIKEHPLVRGGRDGLFPGHEQTWRIP